ncbi:MAG: DUF86 domain-containing protein [Trichodesmium sp.]
MEPEVINKRIELLMKYIERLQSFESVSLDEYLNNFDLQLIAERLIQLIVEVASDINSYLLVQIYHKTPESYFESFIEAGKQGIITQELAAELSQSAGMRNRLVHQYQKINHHLVFAAIPIILEKFPIFIRQIITYLNSLESEKN